MIYGPFGSVERHGETGTEVDEESLTLQALSWPGVELRHLAALSSIASQHSFGRAARNLGYTQSAVSQQIAALERGIGHRLLERSHGRAPVTLTAAGRIVLHHARTIAQELAAARANLDALDRANRSIAIGIHAMTGLHLLPEIVEQMGGDIAPLLKIYESANDGRLLDLIAYEEVDVAFVHPPHRSGLHFVELLREEYVAVTNAEVAERLGSAPVGAAALASFPLFLPNVPQIALDLSRHFESAGASLAPAFVAEYPWTLCELASRGHGIALVPRLVAHSNLNGRIVALRDAPTRRLGLVWREESRRGRRLRSRFVVAATSVLTGSTMHISSLAKTGQRVPSLSFDC